MDLSFARLERDVAVTALPIGLAVLLVGVAARQAASPTARIQARMSFRLPADSLLAPAHCTFHRATARALIRWQEE